MAITVVQAANNQVVSTTGVTVTVSSTGSNNLLVICSKRGADASSNMSVTDSASQTGWTQISSGYATQGTDRGSCFYRPGSTSGITTVTASWSGGVNATMTAVAYEISGIATSTPADGAINTQASSGTTLSSGTIVTTNAHDVLLYALGSSVNQSGWTVGGSYNFPTGSNPANQRMAVQNRIVSGAGSNSTSMTDNSTGTMLGFYMAFADTDIVAFIPDEDSFSPLIIPVPDLPVSVW